MKIGTDFSSSTQKETLASSLALSHIALNVRNLEEMKEFYSTVIGLEVITEDSQKVTLGSDERPLIILHKTESPPPRFGEAGLYHLAILFSARKDLAQAVERILRFAPALFSGSADHLVSEAFYLSDPEGNGIELYLDKDPTTWKWEDGQVQMDAIYIPPEEYIREYASSGEKGDLRLGHVHLKVGDLEAARRFYVDTVGFEITAEMPSALFVSVRKYHHHLGFNTWESRGAGKRPETLGLRNFKILLPARHNLDSLEERLRQQNTPITSEQNTLIFSDPWNNQVIAGVR